MARADFKWSPGGYRAVQNSAAVQALVAQKAESVAGGANAMLSDDGFRNDGFSAHPTRGKFADGYAVTTATLHAARAQEKHEILQKFSK